MSKIIYLLQLEWLKVKTYRPFLALLALYAILLPSFMYSAKKMPLPKEIGGSDILFMFPNIWGYLGYIGNWLVFFLMGFLAIQAISNETFNKTLRQNVISGLSRTDFFLSKLSFLTLINIAATLYYIVWALIFGFTNTETVYASKVFQNIDIAGRYLLMCMGYSSLGLFLGVLFSRSILGLFIYFAYIMFIEKIIRYAIIYKLLGDKPILFTPANVFNDLVPPPIPELINQTLKGSDRPMFLTPAEAVPTALIYIALFLYGAYYLLKTRDL